ncbi:MAG: squalene synthase HpnC [Acidothermus sp.]|nr:squalene synthase HpnC [Acidothermus sp.]
MNEASQATSPSTPLPPLAATLAKAGAENFPVALGFLPRRLRADLRAIYGFARLVDDIGDELDADRPALLDEVDADLTVLFAGGKPRIPAVAALADPVRAGRFPEEPLRKLVEANRMDQRVSRYESFEDLLAYCTLSADPVGRLVLAALGRATPELIALSDQVCSGLQIVEHLQDVGEDVRRGRIYLPQEDMAEFGVREADLHAAKACPPLRALLAFEAERARKLLDAGVPLARAIRGRPKIAIAAFAAGGRAALAAMARVHFDVLQFRCTPRKPRLVGETLAVLLGLRSRPPSTGSRS